MFCYPISVVGCQLSGVSVDFRFYLSVIVDFVGLSGVGCQVLTVGCRVEVSSVVVIGSCLSGVGCWLLVVCIGCHFCSIVGLQLWVLTSVSVSRSRKIFI
jgi:hypothetical protein